MNELKPTIPQRCLEISTNPGDVIFDPFGGGGSTYIAAERLHRFWIGTEIGPIEPILDRFERDFPEMKRTKTLPTELSRLLSLNLREMSVFG